MNQQCIITGGEGCGTVTYPFAPPPYPGSPPRRTSANTNTDRTGPSSAAPAEHINSLPRPRPDEARAAPRDTAESRRHLPEPPRVVRPRDYTSAPSSSSSSSSRPATTAPRTAPTSGNPNRIQGRQSRINSQPRRLAPAHMGVPVTDIIDPPPPYTPYPDYDLPNCHRPQRNTTGRRQPER